MFLFLDLILLCVVVALVLLFVTQIVIPLKNGTALFPMVSRGEVSKELHKAESVLESLSEREQLQKLQKEIDARRAKLNEKENE
jgi:nitrogen fixation/metabolism regulation signal transduction histidine kinase